MLFRVCSRSSVKSEPPVSTRLVVGSNPTGSTLEDWRSGRTYLSSTYRDARHRGKLTSLILRETAGSSWRLYRGLAGVP